jgi:carbonic anhydrase
MLHGAPDTCRDFVAPWVAQATPVVRLICESFPAEETERLAEETVVRLSIENLRTFPWIAEREAAGKLTLTGLHFGIADGILRALKGPGRFEPLA